jgi:hypothetical protein
MGALPPRECGDRHLAPTDQHFDPATGAQLHGIARARSTAWTITEQDCPAFTDIGHDAGKLAIFEVKAVTLPESAVEVPAAAIKAPALRDVCSANGGTWSARSHLNEPLDSGEGRRVIVRPPAFAVRAACTIIAMHAAPHPKVTLLADHVVGGAFEGGGMTAHPLNGHNWPTRLARACFWQSASR